jgi:non-ribosomal peptide synthetase component F
VKDCGTQTTLTYARLDDQSDRVAEYLRQFRFAPETPVAVLSPRSCEAIVSFLGVLKAGLAYLPMDPLTPAERDRLVLDSLPHCKLVLVGAKITMPSWTSQDMVYHNISEILANQKERKCSSERNMPPSATSLAYILFTSGSSGTPKGVAIEHRRVVRVVRNGSTVERLPKAPRIAHLSNLIFDAGTWEIWSALLNGGTLLCIDQASVLDPERLASVFVEERIEGAVMTPTLLKQYWDAAVLKGLAVLHLAGEPLLPPDAMKARNAVPGIVYNAYGEFSRLQPP